MRPLAHFGLAVLFTGLAVLGFYVAALASSKTGDAVAGPEPWWVFPGIVGGMVLAFVFGVAAVIWLGVAVVEWLRSLRNR